MICVCPVCNKKFEARTGAINRALKNGYDIRCGIECAGIARRANKTIRQKKEEKRLYDMQHRAKNMERFKKLKADRFRRDYDPEKARIERQENKKLKPWQEEKRREYMKREEYRRYKKIYDRAFRATKIYGKDWGECLVLMLNLRDECLKQASDYEIRLSKGTLLKTQTRRRDYERLNCNKSENSTLGNLTTTSVRR